MKFSASQSNLLSGLQPLTAVLPAKSPMPVLTHILAQLEGNTLSLSATDLEISMETKIEVKGIKDGRVLFPARKLMELIRDFPDVLLTIESDGERLDLRDQEGKRYELSRENVANYPRVPEIGSAELIRLDRQKLRRMIGKCLFAVSRDELRPQLTGVYMRLAAEELRMVTTDGHRLVKIQHKQSYEGDPQDCIVPAKAMSAVQRICEGEGPVEVAFLNNQTAFRVGNTTVITKLIEGRYPNYEAVIPTENKNILTADLELLSAAVRRASHVSNEISRQIRVKLARDHLEISVENVESGDEGQEKIPCTLVGEPMEIGYNSSYILDILKQIDTSEVVFELGTPTSAAVVRPSEQEEGEDLLMLVMPVRLN